VTGAAGRSAGGAGPARSAVILPWPGPERRGRFRRFFSNLGPGLITGAADDDPSGISTYSVAGAAFGYRPLWTALFCYPLMASVQLMCARLGMVTGRGLAGVVRRRYSRGVLWTTCMLLMVANVINIGADLGGMGQVTEMVTGLPSMIGTPLYAAVIVSLLFFSSYRQMARILKWLTLVLFSYVICAFLAHPDWKAALLATVVPRVDWSLEYLATFVGLMGTTISPYLFFWQSAQEVEEERAMGRRTLAQRKGATDGELRRSRQDVLTGMLFSNVVMYFIMLTSAATLHASGQIHITTAREAARALEPLAGRGAYWLFSLGIVGTGLLAVPVLAGSCAFAVADAGAWRGTLADRPSVGRRFYAVIAASMVLGLLLDFLGLDAVAMLFWAAVVNGVLAPPLIVIVVLLTSDRKVMGDRTNPPLLRWLGWAAAVVMSAGTAAMLLAWR
jgi:NRAMP (natural resistance-associated macrophage protein)-like metal ion transporter